MIPLWEHGSRREAYYLKTGFKGTFDTSVGDRVTRETYSGVLPTLVLNDERVDALDALDALEDVDALEDESLGVESHGEADGCGEEVEGKAVRRYVCTVCFLYTESVL